jgi:hypothetical protein
MKKYFVTANRSNCELVYLWVSPTQGYTMVPNGESDAKRFEKRSEAKAHIEKMRELYRGLNGWKIHAEKQ